jgi:hypothetical protein
MEHVSFVRRRKKRKIINEVSFLRMKSKRDENECEEALRATFLEIVVFCLMNLQRVAEQMIQHEVSFSHSPG